ncbi:tetraspanin-18B-like [Haliotis cracherodii]|uniref:tetraspanin-18B-like n=1 Tax=Haliotis cracherodii TaxID=6455 RepID=UPI0039EA32AF
MGVLVGCSRIFLVIINGIFAVIGLVFLVVGCIVRFGSGILDPYLQDLYTSLQRFMEQAGQSVDLSNFNLGDYLQDATLALILLGVFFFIIGIFGCIGGCCKVRCMLIVYAVLISLIVLAEVLFVILLFTIRDTVDNNIKGPMKTSIEESYTGFNSTDLVSLGWNFAMVNFKCCGVDNYTEFQDAKKWINKYTPKQTNMSITLAVPIACCKLNGSFPNINLPTEFTCATDPTSALSNIDKGCYQAIWDIINDNSNIMIGVGVGVVVVELLMIILACIVCCKEKKKNDDYDDDY